MHSHLQLYRCDRGALPFLGPIPPITEPRSAPIRDTANARNRSLQKIDWCVPAVSCEKDCLQAKSGNLSLFLTQVIFALFLLENCREAQGKKEQNAQKKV